VGFLLGARFGFAVFGRQAIALPCLPECLRIRRQTPLLEVFEAALSRPGEYFHDDVALLDDAGTYRSMI
jgi:hypothetical protein